MRLTLSGEVIRVAGQVVRLLIEAYGASEKTFDEFRQEFVASEDPEGARRGVQSAAARPAAADRCSFSRMMAKGQEGPLSARRLNSREESTPTVRSGGHERPGTNCEPGCYLHFYRDLLRFTSTQRLAV
jgi:hypothetical protein